MLLESKKPMTLEVPIFPYGPLVIELLWSSMKTLQLYLLLTKQIANREMGYCTLFTLIYRYHEPVEGVL